MNRRLLIGLMKAAIVLIGLMAAFAFAFFVPCMISDFGVMFPECAHVVTPYIILIEIGALPIFAAMVCFWRVCTNIAHDDSFCLQNAKLLKAISIMAFADTAYCLLGSIGLTGFAQMNPGTLMISVFVMTAGVLIGAAALLLSELVKKAYLIKQENDLTV